MLDGSSTFGGGGGARITVSGAGGATMASAAGLLPPAAVAAVLKEGRSAFVVLGGEGGVMALDNCRGGGGSCADLCRPALLEAGTGGTGVGAAFVTGAAN